MLTVGILFSSFAGAGDYLGLLFCVFVESWMFPLAFPLWDSCGVLYDLSGVDLSLHLANLDDLCFKAAQPWLVGGVFRRGFVFLLLFVVLVSARWVCHLELNNLLVCFRVTVEVELVCNATKENMCEVAPTSVEPLSRIRARVIKIN